MNDYSAFADKVELAVEQWQAAQVFSVDGQDVKRVEPRPHAPEHQRMEVFTASANTGGVSQDRSAVSG
jgi:hypothetical protein